MLERVALRQGASEGMSNENDPIGLKNIATEAFEFVYQVFDAVVVHPRLDPGATRSPLIVVDDTGSRGKKVKTALEAQT